MDYTASDGVTYRVQFVHSAHDLKNRLLGQPGGLRQFTDNMALSLRRRVTLCEIATVVIDPVAVHENSLPVKHITPVAQGFALCHFHDQFVKRMGRGYALSRALRASDLGDRVSAELADFCGFDYFEELS